MKLRVNRKKIGAWLLVICLLTGLVSGFPVKESRASSPSNYTELTFSDWGIVNGAYNNGEAYTLTDTNITSLDGAAFTGKFTFNGASDFRIGGGDNAWAGLTGLFSGSTLYLSDQTGGGGENGLHGITLSKTTAFKLRMTFEQDVENNKWFVGVWVNDIFVDEYAYSGMTLGKALLINGAGMTLEDVKFAPDYKELTFSDWGIVNGAYINGETYTLTDTNITSLDGAAFTGKFTFNGANDFRIGGGDNAWAGLTGMFSGSTLYLSDQTGGGVENGLHGITLSKTTAFKLRLTFDQSTTNNKWLVGVWVNDVFVNEYIYSGMTLGKAFLINGAGMTLEDVQVETGTPDEPGGSGTPDEPTTPNIPDTSRIYKELTVSDWGITDSSYINGEGYTLTDTSITSLDGTAFHAKLTYNTAADLRIGGGDNPWAGLVVFFSGTALYLSDQTGGGNEYEVQGVTLSKTGEFILRLTFDQDTENNTWKVGVWVNNVYVDQYTYAGMNPGTKLMINGANMTLKDVSYNNLTVSDWGITDASYINGNGYSLTDTNITSLNGTAFHATITYNNAADLRIGGEDNAWAGLTVYISGTTLYLSDQTGGGAEYPVEGVTLSKTEAFKLRLTFEQDGANNKWHVGVWVNDIYANTFTYTGMNLGTNILVNGDGMVLADVQTEPNTPDNPDGPSVPEEPNLSEYTSLTFSDWGIKKDTYVSGTGYALKDTSITTLDKTSFVGKLTYNTAADLRLGGDESGWAGLVVHFSGGKLYLSDQTGGGSEHGIDVDFGKNDEFQLRLAFDRNEEDNNWEVGVWIGDTYKGTFTYVGMNLGTRFLVNGGGMILESVPEEADDPNVPEEPNVPDLTEYKSLTFTDWGIKKGSYINGNGYALKDTSITTLDKTSFVGKLTYNTAADLRIGGGESGWDGLVAYFSGQKLYFSDQTGGGSEYGIDVDFDKTEEFQLRLTFDKNQEDNNWEVGIWIGDTYKGSFTYVGMKLGTRLLINGNGMILESVPQDDSEENEQVEKPDTSIKYVDKTLSDWNIMDGEYIAGQGYTLEGVTSLNGVALNVSIGTWNAIGLRVGGKDNAWAGIYFQGKAEGLLVASQVAGYEEGGVILPYTIKDLSKDTFVLRLTFDIDEKNNVRLGIWIDDVFQRYLNYEGMGAAMGTSLLFDASGITLEDVGNDREKEEGSEKPKTLPKNFREVTFESFGIKDKTYKYVKDSMSVEGLYMLQLDKTIFSGDICFSKDKIVDFRYGGLNSQWYGLIFTNTADGKIYLQGIADDKVVTDTYIFNSKKAGTTLVGDWFNLKLTTEILDTDGDGKEDDVRLGVWFDHVLYNNKYIDLQDYAQHLGSNCGVYVREKGGFVKVRSDKNVYIGVDFTLFGFTRDWAKELGIL